MTEMSASALAFLQTAASAGLVVCLVMAGAFATLGFAASGEQGRRQTAAEAERIARIGELLRENEYARAALEAAPASNDEDTNGEPVGADGPVTGVGALAAGAPPAAEPESQTDEVLASARSEENSGELTALATVSGPLDDDVVAGSSVAEVVAAEDASSGATADAAADIAELAAAGEADVPLDGAEPGLALWAVPARKLAADEATAIADALRGENGTFTVEIVTAPEAEARLYAIQLAGALRGAGIDAQGPVAVLTTQQTGGVVVSAEEGADGPGATLLGALQSAGLDASPTSPGTPLHDVLVPDMTDVRLYVGGLKTPAPPAPEGVQPRRARILEPA